MGRIRNNRIFTSLLALISVFDRAPKDFVEERPLRHVLWTPVDRSVLEDELSKGFHSNDLRCKFHPGCRVFQSFKLFFYRAIRRAYRITSQIPVIGVVFGRLKTRDFVSGLPDHFATMSCSECNWSREFGKRV